MSPESQRIAKKEPARDDVEVKGQDELLPCPFCGSPDSLELGNPYEENFRWSCLSCKAATDRYRTRNEAMAAWNQRAVSTSSGSNASSLTQTEKERKAWADKHISPDVREAYERLHKWCDPDSLEEKSRQL